MDFWQTKFGQQFRCEDGLWSSAMTMDLEGVVSQQPCRSSLDQWSLSHRPPSVLGPPLWMEGWWTEAALGIRVEKKAKIEVANHNKGHEPKRQGIRKEWKVEIGSERSSQGWRGSGNLILLKGQGANWTFQMPSEQARIAHQRSYTSLNQHILYCCFLSTHFEQGITLSTSQVPS